MLFKLEPGDEVIMPSFTFVSTANAFVLRGAVPVFVDIREDTLNLDERLIEAAITPRTRAIVPVHYAGVSCEMDTITDTAARHGLKIVEDAAQGIMAGYKGRPLGAIGDIGCLSFHETKNVISGEGGPACSSTIGELVQTAEIMRRKRAPTAAGSFAARSTSTPGRMSDPRSCRARSRRRFMWAQLRRPSGSRPSGIAIWRRYHDMLAPLEQRGVLRRPVIPTDCQHNGHIYYILIETAEDRSRVLTELNRNGVNAVFHYVPLHSSPAGMRFGRAAGDLAVTTAQAERLVRLPTWLGLSESQQQRVCDVLRAIVLN